MWVPCIPLCRISNSPRAKAIRRPTLPRRRLLHAMTLVEESATGGFFRMRYALGLAGNLMLPIAAFAQSSTHIAGTWSLVFLSEDHHGQITHPVPARSRT